MPGPVRAAIPLWAGGQRDEMDVAPFLEAGRCSTRAWLAERLGALDPARTASETPSCR